MQGLYRPEVACELGMSARRLLRHPHPVASEAMAWLLQRLSHTILVSVVGPSETATTKVSSLRSCH